MCAAMAGIMKDSSSAAGFNLPIIGSNTRVLPLYVDVSKNLYMFGAFALFASSAEQAVISCVKGAL